MSISSTGLYGSATIVNSDLFTDVETLKETVTTLNTTYLQTTAEHRADISQNRFDISSNLSKIIHTRFILTTIGSVTATEVTSRVFSVLVIDRIRALTVEIQSNTTRNLWPGSRRNNSTGRAGTTKPAEG